MFLEKTTNIKEILEKYKYKCISNKAEQSFDKKLIKRSLSKLDIESILKSKTLNQQKQFQALKKSQLFSNDRKQTFVKFNYRFNQPNGYSYPKVFHNVMSMDRNQKINKSHRSHIERHRGTMNVIQLWSQKRLKQAVGSLACPQDRSKVLKYYAEKKFKHRVNTAQINSV